MRQYLEAKRQHPLALVLFRMGDFYELFYEDALVAARALDLTLTSRSKDATGAAVPMCGVPHHAADGYITRLVRKGHRVAICEQVEDPRKAKGVVRREVVRVVSPGTLADAGYLDAREPAFLLAVTGLEAPADPQTRLGVALLDLSTGEFQVAEYHGAHARQALDDDVAVLAPREIVAATGVDVHAALPSAAAIPVTAVDGWSFDAARATETLRDQLRVSSLDGFGLAGRPGAVAAAGALVRYLRDTQKADLAHVRTLRLRESAGRLLVDPTTVRHLELVESSHGGRAGSLLDEIDRTVTPDGRPADARLAAGPAGDARADPRPARRRRGAGVPGRRSRQGARDAEDGARPRAADVAGGAGHRQPARSGRRCGRRWRRCRGCGCCWPSAGRRCWPAWWRSSTTWPTCAPPSRPRSSTSRRRWPATAT